MSFDAGSIISTLDLNRTPFRQGLAQARREAESFARRRYAATLDVNSRGLAETHADLLELTAAAAAVDASRTTLHVGERGLTETFADLVDLGAVAEVLDGRRVALDVSADGASQTAAELALVGSEAQRVDGQTTRVRVDDSEVRRATQEVKWLQLAIAGIGPALIPIGGAALGALGAIGVGGLAAAGGLSAAMLGTAGLGDAVKALGEQQKAQGENAAAAARQQRAAAEQIRSAKDGVVTAERQLEAAERNYSMAVRDAQRAQESLTEARRDARRAIEDLQFSVAGGALAERRAVINLAEAQEDLAKARTKGVTGRELDKLILNQDEARLSLDELRVRNQRLRDEKAETDRKGVEGSKQVVAAQDRITAANERVRSAQEAMTVAAEGVARAQRRVAEAQLAAAEAANTTSAATKKATEAMAKLSPTGREFVRFLIGLEGNLTRLRHTAQEGLLPGVQDGIEALLKREPEIHAFIGAYAGALGDLSRRAGEALAGPEWTGHFAWMKDQATPTLDQFGRIFNKTMNGVLWLVRALAPVWYQMGDGLEDLTGKWERFTREAAAGKHEGFNEFLAFVREAGPEVVHLLGAAGRALLHVADALAEPGLGSVKVLTAMFEVIAILPEPVIQGLVGLFLAVRGVQAAQAGLLALTGAVAAFKSGGVFRNAAEGVTGLIRKLTGRGGVTDGLDAIKGKGGMKSALLGLDGCTSTRACLDDIGSKLDDVDGKLDKTRKKGGLKTALAGGAALAGGLAGYLAADEYIPKSEEFSGPFNNPVSKAARDQIGDTAALIRGDWSNLNPTDVPKIVGGATSMTGLFTTIVERAFAGGDFSKTVRDWWKRNVNDPAEDGAVSTGAAMTGAAHGAWEGVTSWWGRTFTDSDSWWSRTRTSAGLQWGGLRDDVSLTASDTWSAVTGWWSRTFTDSDSWWSRTRGSVGGWASGLRDDASLRASETWSNVTGWWGRTFTDSDSWWSRTRSSADTWWSSTRDAMGAKAGEAKDRVIGAFSVLGTWWGSFWTGVVDLAQRTWDRIKGITAAPVNFVVQTVYGRGIKGVWDKVVDWIPGLPRLPDPGPEIRWATGTSAVLPGYTPGRDVHRFVNPRTGQALALSGGEAVLRPEVTRALGGSGFVDTVNTAARTGGLSAVERMLGGDPRRPRELAFAAGGVIPALTWARSQTGKPYSWGAVGPGAYDCSGYWSSIVGALLGLPLHQRRFTTASFGAPRVAGWVRGGGGPVQIGVTPNAGNGIGHMAGTILGTNLESRGGAGVVTGGAARGAAHPLFTMRYGWAGVGGMSSAGADASVAGVFDAGSWIREQFAGVLGGAADVVGKFGDSPFTQAIAEVPGKLVDVAVDKAVSMLGALGLGGGGDVERWRGTVLQSLARVGQPAIHADRTLRRMNQESGGNPRAINTWDSNARRGTPSKGLMQVIDPTFRAHRDPGLPNDIWDPLANVTASMRYALARYRSLPAAYDRAGGYDNGGPLQPGWTLAYNGTGRPENVQSPAQAAAAARGGDGAETLLVALEAMTRRIETAVERARTINVHPREGQSEESIAAMLRRREEQEARVR